MNEREEYGVEEVYVRRIKSLFLNTGRGRMCVLSSVKTVKHIVCTENIR